MVGLADAGRTVTYGPPRREDLVVSGFGTRGPSSGRISPVTSTGTQPAPPAGPTVASEAGVTVLPIDVQPRRPTLTPKKGDDREPRPSTLATQEIGLGLAFTGGVSLAVWMGGVARE